MSNSATIAHLSKFLSLILRHRPEVAGLELDPQGWVEVDVLLEKVRAAGHKMDRALLDTVVATNNKKRFAFSEDVLRIRASQGHSVSIELGYEPVRPPEWLFHGTATRHLAAIRTAGLIKGKRHHVHLSRDEATALQVGGRHGKAIVLRVRAGEMHAAGHAFFCSENGVWLTDAAPPEYLEFPLS